MTGKYTDPFDPAAWLEQAIDHYGYKIGLVGGDPDRWGYYTIAPKQHLPDEHELWQWLHGDPETASDNERAVVDFMAASYGAAKPAPGQTIIEYRPPER